MWSNYLENSAYSSNIANQIGIEPMIYQNQFSFGSPNNSLYTPTSYMPFEQQSEQIRSTPPRQNKKFMLDTKNKIFIANLNNDTNEEELKNYFSKFGNLTEVNLIKDRDTKRPKGFGFLKYADSFMVEEVMKNRPHCIGNRQLDVKRMIPKKNQNQKINSNTQKIYISGFGSDLSEKELRNYFEMYGNILSVNLKPPRIGMTMCYGFITFDDYDSVDKIILQKNHFIKGYSLKIRKFTQNEKENYEKIGLKNNFNLYKQFRFQPYSNFRTKCQNLYGKYQTSEHEQTNFVDLINNAVKQGYTLNQNEFNFGAERMNIKNIKYKKF